MDHPRSGFAAPPQGGTAGGLAEPDPRRSLGNSTASLLAAYLAACSTQREPFSWGAHNCCHFAAGWVRFAGRVDPMAYLPPTPDVRAALRLVQQLGGDLRCAWSRQLGAEPVAAAHAQTGDIVLVPTGDIVAALAGRGTGHVAGVCSGRHAVLQTADGSIAFVPLTSAVCAWHLPALELAAA